LVPIVRRLQRAGRRVALTNGCFDLLHVGHLSSLEELRRQADLLVVAVNSDSSMRRLKGAGRPLVPARERALLVAGLKPVDYVMVFPELTPLKVVRTLRPDLLGKGSDWKGREVVGRREVESWGGRVVLLKYRSGHSTTELLRRARNARKRKRREYWRSVARSVIGIGHCVRDRGGTA